MFSKRGRTRKSKTSGETKIFVETTQCHEEPNSRLDKISTSDMYGVEGERLISEEPPIISALVAQKKKSRASKGKSFNCFVIDRSKIDPSTGRDELEEFLRKLKRKISSLPDPTRFQVNVFDRGHWYPIDFYIKDGQVNSFIIDAVNDERYKKTFDYIGRLFPSGNHYQFFGENELKENAKNQRIADLVGNDGNLLPKYYKLATMQKSGKGCRVFSVYHAMNMANSDPKMLYSALERSRSPTVRQIPSITSLWQVVDELYVESRISGAVTLRSIQPDETLVRLIRPTQSYTQLNDLDEKVRDIEISRDKGNITLAEHAHESRENVGGRDVNATILTKSQKYRKKILDFRDQHTKEEIDSFMEHRSGFAYLENPDLFKLDKLISLGDKQEVLQAAKLFFNNFYENMPKETFKSLLGIRLTAKNLHISEQSLLGIEKLINSYDKDEITKGEFVCLFMLQIQELQDKLIDNESVRTLNKFRDAVHAAAYPDEPQNIYQLK